MRCQIEPLARACHQSAEYALLLAMAWADATDAFGGRRTCRLRHASRVSSVRRARHLIAAQEDELVLLAGLVGGKECCPQRN